MNDAFSQNESPSVELGDLPFGIEKRVNTAMKRLTGEMNTLERRMAIAAERGGLIPTFAGDSPLLSGADIDSAQSSSSLPDNVEVLSGDPPEEALEVARQNASDFKRITVRTTEGTKTSERIADAEPKVIVSAETHGVSDSVTLFKQEVGEPLPENNQPSSPRRGVENPGSSEAGPPSMGEAADQKFR